MDILTWIKMLAGLFLLLVPLIIIKVYLEYKKLSSIKNTSFKFAFKPIFFLSVAPLFVLSYPLFAVYRQIVNLILAYKVGSKYWGLLDGRDAVSNLENKNPAHILFIIKYPSNRSQTFYDAVKETVYKAFKSSTNPRIFGAVRTFQGYSYLVKNEVTFDDCFRKLHAMNTPIDKDNLIQAIEQYTTIPLPKNREGLWDMFVGTQPVQWMDDTEDDEAKCYPVLFRMNHTLADFGHLINGIVQLFADNSNVQFGCDAHVYQREKPSLIYQQSSLPVLLNFFADTLKALKFYARDLYFILVGASVCLVNSLLMVDNTHILHGPKLNHNKHLLAILERLPHHVEMVKRIKKKVPGSTFEDVCLTALTASIKEFLQKSLSPIPEYITAEMPAIPLSLIKPETLKDGELICRNKLTFYVCRLPLNIDLNVTKPLTELLKVIEKEKRSIKNSLEYDVNYFIARRFGNTFPAPILQLIANIVQDCTIVVSNIPGPTLITVLDGCPVQDICPWVTTRGNTGIGFVIFVYDKKMQISLAIDKALTFNRSEVQSLVDGFFKHLHLLDEETV